MCSLLGDKMALYDCQKCWRLQTLFIQIVLLVLCQVFCVQTIIARDLAEIQEEGILRHIGIPYSNFVIYSAENDIQMLSGLDVDLLQGFAEHIGVEYQFVPATLTDFFGKLNGQEAVFKDGEIVLGKRVIVQGDILASGMTILDWRTRLVDFGDDYFPSGIWLVARGDSDLQPIIPTGFLEEDIQKVKRLIKGRDVLTMDQSCLDSNLYDLKATGARLLLFEKKRNLSEMVPALLNNDAEVALLDVVDALLALEKWPGEIKVIGPISGNQLMAPMFRKKSPILQKEFNEYLQSLKESGAYTRLARKYYSSIFFFYSEYFETL